MIQAVSLAGALLILLAFSLQLLKRWTAEDLPYLWCNLVGAATLTAVAWLERQWGFLLMESVWSLVSLYGLVVRRPAV